MVVFIRCCLFVICVGIKKKFFLVFNVLDNVDWLVEVGVWFFYYWINVRKCDVVFFLGELNFMLKWLEMVVECWVFCWDLGGVWWNWFFCGLLVVRVVVSYGLRWSYGMWIDREIGKWWMVGDVKRRIY